MRRVFLLCSSVLGGLAVGIAATFFVTRSAPQLGVPDEAAILTVRSPTFEGIVSDEEHGIDDVWRRQIKTHVFRMRQRELLRDVLSDLDVQKMAWYKAFNDPVDRLQAFERQLHVEHVPETSIVLVWFSSARRSESRTVANVLARTYMKGVAAEIRTEDYFESEHLAFVIYDFSHQEKDIKLELSRTDDPSRIEDLQFELAGVRERRLDLKRDLQEHNLRARDRGPIGLIRPAIDSSFYGRRLPGHLPDAS